MSYKKSFFTLCLLLLGTLSCIYSQEKASDVCVKIPIRTSSSSSSLRVSDISMDLPASAKQYYDEVKMTIRYKLDPGDSDLFSWGDDDDRYVVISETSGYESNGYKFQSRNVVFIKSGSVTFIVDGQIQKKIVISINPLELSVPSHICPGGTQISCSAAVSSLLTKSYSVSGNSTAKISNTGLLTYISPENGLVKVDMSLYYNNKVLVTVDKNVSLDFHHAPSGHYSFDYNGTIYDRSLNERNNLVDWGSSVTATFYLQGMTNCYAELLTYDAAVEFSHMKYGDLYKVEFRPVGNEGDIISIRLRYNKPNCPNLITYDCHFIIEGSYSVAYSSNVLTIKKQIVQKNRSLSTNVDQYMLIDALTGNLVKRGQLAQDVTDINISGTPKGIYIVKIISKNNTKSYKILVN